MVMAFPILAVYWQQVPEERAFSNPRVMTSDALHSDTGSLPPDDREERYRSILASMAEGVVFQDTQGRIIFSNPSAERILELSNRALGDFSTPLEQRALREDGSPFPAAEAPVLVTLRTGRSCRGVVMGLRKTDDTIIWISINSEPLKRHGEAAPYAVVSTFTDVTQQRLAEAALKEREKLFRTLVENQQEGIGIVDLEERFTFANPAAEGIFGVEAGTLTGRSLLEFLPPASVEVVRKQTQARVGGRPSVYELEFRRESDRSPRTIFVSATPQVDDCGKVCGTLGVFHDITDRKRVETSLQESEERLRLATEAIGLGTFDVYPQTGQRIWSDLTKQLFGFPPEAVISREDFLGAVHPEDRARVAAEVDDLMKPEQGPRSWSEFRTVDARDGRERWVSTWGRTFFDEQGRPVRLIGVARDITERKRAAQALGESEGRFRLTFDQAPIGAAILGLDRRYVRVNEALCRFLNCPAEELIGKSVAEVTHPEDREIDVEQCRALEEGRLDLVRIDKRYLRKDGSVVWCQVTVRLLRDSDGRALYFLTMVEDTTERKKAENEHERLQAQLAQAKKMESIGRLAGGVAHDFNNLLTVINGYSSLAMQRLAPGDPLAYSIEEILRAGETAAALVRQLLAFSRKQVLQKEPVHLNEMVSGMEKMLVRLMGEDIEIVTRLTPAVGPVLADRHQIEQVILNLAVNGRGAMPQGGTLTIETDRVSWGAHCPRCLATVPPGSYVSVTVSDTGIGMDEETRQHLFEPFFTTKEIGQGTGLGLATVHGIILQSGGHIDVESQLGEGTSFHLYLPTMEVPAGERGLEPKRETPAPERGSETILLVEDQDDVRKFAATVLQMYGYRVLLASSAEEALQRYAGHPVDLLLTDVVMPKVNGSELAAQLRSLQPRARVLFMSGYSEELLREHAGSMNGAGFLHKPFTPEILTSKVREVLGTAGPAGNEPSR